MKKNPIGYSMNVHFKIGPPFLVTLPKLIQSIIIIVSNNTARAKDRLTDRLTG